MAVPYEFVKSFVQEMNPKLFGMYSKAVEERKSTERELLITQLVMTLPQEVKDFALDGLIDTAKQRLSDITGHDSKLCADVIRTFRSNFDGLQESDPLD